MATLGKYYSGAENALGGRIEAAYPGSPPEAQECEISQGTACCPAKIVGPSGSSEFENQAM